MSSISDTTRWFVGIFVITTMFSWLGFFECVYTSIAEEKELVLDGNYTYNHNYDEEESTVIYNNTMYENVIHIENTNDTTKIVYYSDSDDEMLPNNRDGGMAVCFILGIGCSIALFYFISEYFKYR